MDKGTSKRLRTAAIRSFTILIACLAMVGVNGFVLGVFGCRQRSAVAQRLDAGSDERGVVSQRRASAVQSTDFAKMVNSPITVDDWQNRPQDGIRIDFDAFTFVRVKYDSSGGYGESWYRHEGRDWMRWETDYPRAELNLLFRLNQLTSMRVNPKPIVRTLDSSDLGDYPFLFMSDVGWQVLSDREAKSLSGYLTRGGFLWIDDFWGDAEWQNLVDNTQRMGPQWQWVPIPKNHEVYRSVYPMDMIPQIPARIFFQSGWPHDPPQVHRWPAGGIAGVNHVRFMGLFDQAGRLAAIATHNTDIADGWEREGEDREFFQRFSISSYAITINIITYAMTH